MSRGSQASPITHIGIVGVALGAGITYALNMEALPLVVGLLAIATVGLGFLPVAESKAGLVLAGAFVLMGVGMVWAVGGDGVRAARLVRNLGWTQAILGLWQTYVHASALLPKRASPLFGAKELERWREGDVRFGLELAERIVVHAQPSWVALVLETAWPAPHPPVVEELLHALLEAPADELQTLRERMSDKGGTDRSEARWELARRACEVAIDAVGRPKDELGGLAVGRFVMAAAAVEADDERKAQIFSALVIPAIANPRQ